MFHEVTFREILLPSSGNINDYVMDIYREYADLEGKNKTKDKKKLRDVTN